jgi:hypothetical protein
MTAEDIVRNIMNDNTPVDKDWVRHLEKQYKTEESRMDWAMEFCRHYAEDEDNMTLEDAAWLLREELFNEYRYELRESEKDEGIYLLVDKYMKVVVRFEEHKFNETQKASVLDDKLLASRAEELGVSLVEYIAHLMKSMGQHMSESYYSIAMPIPVHEIKYDRQLGKTLVIRHKFPKFRIEVEEPCEVDTLGAAVKKAGEFLRHLKRKD